MNPKVSIIVPVYNTEKYLPKCILSLLSQSLKDIEIILVDDGSFDNSLGVIKDFAKNDERIKVISQANKGQSAARNEGLKIAKGEYIGFIDSDDFADFFMFEKMYNKAKVLDSDILMCSINVLDEKTKKITANDPYFSLNVFSKEFDDAIFTEKDCESFLFRICVVPWNKLFKADFLRNNAIKFFEGVSFEDNIFTLEAFLKASRIALTREPLVFYRKGTPTSLTYGTSDRAKLDLFKVFDEMKNVLKQSGKWDKYKTHFEIHRRNTLLYWYRKITDSDVKRLYEKNPDFVEPG